MKYDFVHTAETNFDVAWKCWRILEEILHLIRWMVVVHRIPPARLPQAAPGSGANG